MKRRVALLIPLVLLMALFLGWVGSRENSEVPAAAEPAITRNAGSEPVSEFRDWNRRARAGGTAAPDDLAKGIELAAARREAMAGWIAADPEMALKNAVSWSEYQALPEALLPYFEKPFNALGNLRVLPVCHPEAGPEPLRLLEINGKSWTASVFGWRLSQATKESAPLAGITLDDRAAVSESVFEILDPADHEALASLPLGNRDPTRDFASGKPLGETPITALAGGRRFLFENPASVAATNAKLADFDQTPGPHGGSRLVFELADGGDGSVGIDWAEAGDLVRLQASAWTETPKSVFFIRVDFSDLPGAAVTQAALAQVLNTSVADSIEEMSYGKTTINAAVSSMTVRMPSPKTFYLPSNNTALLNDAKSAYLALAGATALNGYDIVGVHFPAIGIQSGGVTYAGLAGGSNQWLQGTSSSGVIIHEFGHNYGLGHASFWDTSDGSVVGAGSSVEYGDPFDIMGGGPDPEGHFHMQGKKELNWLDSSQWTDATATGSGTYRLHRFDHSATTGVRRGLRVTKAASPAQYYWLGYRPGIPGNPWLQNGAYLVWQRPGQSRSWLLDATPVSGNDSDDAALAVGRTYSDTAAAVHITPLAVGGSGPDAWLDVNVQLGSFPGNAAPSATLNAPLNAAARTVVNFSVAASDTNGDTLAYSWDFGDGSVSPNASSTNHSWSVGGTYSVKVTVSDMKGGSVTKTQAVTVTDPLDTWSAGTVVAGRDVSEVAYLDGRFMAGGIQYLYLSFNGSTWSEQDLGINFQAEGFASDGTKFVAAGYDWNGASWYGKIHHSSDGKYWKASVMPATGEIRDVAYGGGVFVAVGESGVILRSNDGGSTWTHSTSPGVAALSAVAFGGGVFVAVGDTSVFTSPDGVSWTDRSAGSGLESWHNFKDVTYANGLFIAGGYYSGIRISSDGGVNWSSTTIAGGADYDISAFAAGGGAITATAVRKTSPFIPVLLVSQDGGIWEESGVSSFPDTASVTHGDGVFLTVHGSAGASFQSGAFHPLNQSPTASIIAPSTGSARVPVFFLANAADPDGNPLILVWDFKDGTSLREGSSVSHAFPSGGSYSVDLIATDTLGGVTVTSHSITIIDPLTSWTQRVSGTTSELKDIAYGGGKLVAVGDGNGTYRTSSDGVLWSGGTIGINIYLNGIIHDGSQFVAVGSDYNFASSAWTGAIYTSPNGTTWTRRHFSGNDLHDIAYGGGAYVAVGNAGTLWRSTNATSWSPVSSGIAANLEGVAYGNGGFVAVGAAGTGGNVAVITSSSGSSWTNTSAGAGVQNWQGLYDIEFCSDRFLASGWYSKIRHSTDGGATFVSNESVNRQIPAFAFGNGIFFAAGINKDGSDADTNLLSVDGATWIPTTTLPQANRNSAIFFNNTFITVGSNGNIWQSNSFTAPPDTGYPAWQEIHFPGTPPLSAADDDFDGDGMPNLGEYATGTDPRDGSDRVPVTTAITGGYFTLTILRDPAVTDVDIRVQSSTNLQTWSAGGTTVVENNANRLVVRISTPVGHAEPKRGFLRVVFDLLE